LDSKTVDFVAIILI